MGTQFALRRAVGSEIFVEKPGSAVILVPGYRHDERWCWKIRQLGEKLFKLGVHGLSRGGRLAAMSALSSGIVQAPLLDCGSAIEIGR